MFKISTFLLPAALVRTLLIILLLTSRLLAVAQAPAWQSARAVAVATAASRFTNSEVTATAVDATGNVFVAGYFTDAVVLGSTTLTSPGGSEVFVAKFNPSSNQFVWAQRAGGMSDDVVTALAVSGTSIYLVGSSGSLTADFGATTIASGAFVAKLTDLSSTSSFVWAQRVGGTAGVIQATAVAVGGASVYVAGYFSSSTISFGAITLNNAGDTDVFVAKLTDAGSTSNFVWAQRAGGAGGDRARALAVSGSSVYVAGFFAGLTASFGSIGLTNVGATNVPLYPDAFVAKMTDAGSTSSFIWAQQAGGVGQDYVAALAVSGTSIYMTGGFNGGAFNSPTAGFGAVTLINSGGYNVFVVKLVDAGSTSSFVWGQQAGGTGTDLPYAIAVSGTNVYVAGYFGQRTASFGTTTLTSVGGSDAFVAKLTDVGSTGSFAWAQRAGSPGQANANALSISRTSVHVAGLFIGSPADFGSIVLTNPNLTSVGFLASLTDPTLTATTAGRAQAAAQLYPNPAHHTATLRLPAGTAPVPLTLTDALGRAVRRYPAPAGSDATLDLRGLPAGLYLLLGAGPAQRLAVE